MSNATQIDLQVTGMHCASCAARLEKALNQLPEVAATVSIATEKAYIAYNPHNTPLIDITLMRNDLISVADAIALSRATLKKIRQNLFFTFAYNVLGIPLAAAELLNPMIAGAARHSAQSLQSAMRCC